MSQTYTTIKLSSIYKGASTNQLFLSGVILAQSVPFSLVVAVQPFCGILSFFRFFVYKQYNTMKENETIRNQTKQKTKQNKTKHLLFYNIVYINNILLIIITNIQHKTIQLNDLILSILKNTHFYLSFHTLNITIASFIQSLQSNPNPYIKTKIISVCKINIVIDLHVSFICDIINILI